MSDQDKFERILVSLHDAMLDETLWPATSALIDAACGTVGNALMIREGSQDDSRVLFVGSYYRGERREEWERKYLEIYHPINEGVPRFRQLPAGRVVHVADLYTAHELQTSPTYNEAFLRSQCQNGVYVRLDEPDDSHISWCFHDPISSCGWGSAQLAMVKAVLPHIRQFVRVRQALVRAEALNAALSALLDNTRLGVICLDRCGRVVEANDRARHILRQGDGLVDRDGVLAARIPADRARLEQMLAAALPTSGLPAVSGSIMLRRTSVWPPFVVHVKPVPVRHMDFGAQLVAALVLVVEPGHVARIDPTLVAAMLELTLVEGQIAAWVAEGQTVREIAAATGRTEGSIYWYLNQIYRKQGIARQTDLVRLVLSVAVLA